MDGSFSSDPPAADALASAGVDASFQAAVDAFMARCLTPELQQAGRQTTGLKSARWACHQWRAALLEAGWLAPAWPKRHGGAGWTTQQRLYFEKVCAEQDAPVVMCSGIRTIGPLIIAAGSEAQKQRYLPAILSGEHEWCQGFSEPQAGSDLTALSLRAERDGADFILNGSKIWTSFAQYASHMFLLARCDPDSVRGDGLVFLLVDLASPGIEVRPIPFIDGEAETNQVFFDNVRVAITDRIGEIGDGWAAAKQLMAIARSNNTTTGVLRRALRMAHAEAMQDGEMDPALRARFAQLRLEIENFQALESRAGASGRAINCSAPSSVLKLLSTELHQRITELGIEASPNSALALKKYFSTRAATIYSGTSEVHRNILMKAISA